MKSLNVDRAAVFLIRRYGDDCAKVAYLRAQQCQCRGAAQAASEWKLVVQKVVELHFAPRSDPLH